MIPARLRLSGRDAALYGAVAALGAMLLLPYHMVSKAMPVPSFHAEAVAAAAGLLAVTALLARRDRLVLPGVAATLVAFAALPVVQALFGMVTFFQQALLGALYLLWALALAVAGATLRRELGLERVASTLAWCLVAGAAVSSLFGLAQHYQAYGALGRYIVTASGGRVWGNLAQPNHLADYLALGLASIGFLFATGRLRTLYAAAIGIVVVYVLSLTGSRAGMVYLIAMAILAGGFWLAQRSRVNRRLLLFALACMAVFYVAPAVVETPSGAPQGVAALERLAARTGEQRPRLWYAGWRLFQEAPLFGVGFRQFGYEYFLLNAELPAPRVTGLNDHAHNLVLQVAAEFGLVGVAVLLAGVAAWLWGLRRQPRDPGLWWALAIAAVIGLHSMVEYPLWYTFFLGPAALVLGLADGRTVEWRPPSGRIAQTRLLLASMLALGWFALGQLVVDYLHLEGFLAYRYRYLHATAAVNQRAKEALLDLHRRSLLAPLVELGLARSIQVDEDHLQDKLVVNDRAMRAQPVSDVVYRQAMLLAMAGEVAQGCAQWRRAVAAYPTDEATSALVLQRRLEDGVAGLAPLQACAAAMHRN